LAVSKVGTINVNVNANSIGEGITVGTGHTAIFAELGTITDNAGVVK
jgi:hypothetical protein